MIELLKKAGYSEKDIELYLDFWRNPMGRYSTLLEETLYRKDTVQEDNL